MRPGEERPTVYAEIPPQDEDAAAVTPAAPAPPARIAGTAGAPLRSSGGPASGRLVARSWILVSIVASVAALALGREVLVPLALAGVLAFLLAPVANRFERLRLGRAPSAVIAALALVAALIGVGWIVATQTADLALKLPAYERNIQSKLGSIRGGAFAAPFGRAMDGLRRLEGELEKNEAASKGVDPKPASDEPAQAVRVVEPPTSLFSDLKALVSPLLAPFGSAAMVILLTIFFLAYRGDLRDRLIRLVSRGQIGLTAQALEDASRRLSRYLGTMVLVNAAYGLMVGIGLWACGVPNAPLWGLLSALLRFIPYVGVWIGAIAPLALSFAAFEGWERTIAVFLVVLVTDVVAGNVIEPWVYGKQTGISPPAVIVATLFWTAIWGLPGLLLALPMTLCLAVAGRYVPGFEFLDVLLGDAPALGPAERVYERLAALDPDGARHVAEEVLSSGSSLEATYDDVMLTALRLASIGRRTGQLEDARFHDLCVGLLEATDGLPAPAASDDRPAILGRVLCLPAGDDADRVACELLARLLATRGTDVEVGNPTAMSGEVAERVESEQPLVVCVASIPPLGAPRVRYLVKRIRAKAPGTKMLAAVWDPSSEREKATVGLTAAGADQVAFTLHEAVEGVRRLLAEVVTPPEPVAARVAEKVPS